MRTNKRAGFSLLEVMIVAAVGMVLSATAVPNMVTGISNMRLRSSMTSLSGVVQNSRMLAIKNNRSMTTHFVVRTYGANTGVMAYVKRASDTSSIAGTDSQVQLEEPITRMTAPAGTDAPPELDTTELGFTPQTGDPSFNPIGLPCVYSSGACANSGFVSYFHDARPHGQMGWAALTISPAGRLKKWFWNGSSWTD